MGEIADRMNRIAKQAYEKRQADAKKKKDDTETDKGFVTPAFKKELKEQGIEDTASVNEDLDQVTKGKIKHIDINLLHKEPMKSTEPEEKNPFFGAYNTANISASSNKSKPKKRKKKTNTSWYNRNVNDE